MIYAYEDGIALHLTTSSTRGTTDLFVDETLEALFAFASSDVHSLTKMMVQYLFSRVDVDALATLEPEEDLLPKIHERLRSLHPFFKSSDHSSAIPDLLAASLNTLLVDKTVSEEKYYELLEHLACPALDLCLADTPLHGSLLFKKKYFQEFQGGNSVEWKKRGITSLASLQRYTQLYLYWILDMSSVRFKGLNQDDRLTLFSRVFGSVNQWQPLSIKEVSCVGTPEEHTVAALLHRGQWNILENLDDMDGAVEKTKEQVASEIERQSYASVLREVTSDDVELNTDINRWLETQRTKKETSQPLFKAYEISYFSDYVLLQLRLLTEKQVIVRKCKNCGQYFITERSNTDYCQRILPGETQTCFVIGPKRVFNRNLSSDIPRGLYSKAYKKYQSRLRRQAITEDEWNDWKVQAKKMLEDVQESRISLDSYTEWMER